MIELNEVATVADISRVQAQRRPDAAALIFEGRETSFGEIDAAASRIANQLIASGITPQ
jgi:non-ribosomal peptide synthetase component F